MDVDDFHNKRLTLLLVATKENGDDDMAVFGGIGRVEAGVLWLDRGGDIPRFEIRHEWLERIREVAPESRQILLDADYYLPPSVGNIASGDDSFEATGLKWPD